MARRLNKCQRDKCTRPSFKRRPRQPPTCTILSMTTGQENKNQLSQKVFWGLLGAALATVVALTAVQLVSDSTVTTLTVLSVASAVAFLICRHKPQMPRTKIDLLAKNVFPLWGII